MKFMNKFFKDIKDLKNTQNKVLLIKECFKK